MLSIIIKEHEETPDKILGMIKQSSDIPIEKELIIATSKSNSEFLYDYDLDGFDFDIRVVTNTKNAGNGVYLGCMAAKGDNLLVMDCHVCYSAKDTTTLINTLDRNPYAMVTPVINIVNFPSCTLKAAGLGYGVKFKITSEKSFEWVWLQENGNKEYPVPISCGGAFAMKRHTFDLLFAHGGMDAAFDFEEERSMRLWRLGIPTLLEPRAIFGHWFKENMSTIMKNNWYKSRVCALYINILDENNWNNLEKVMPRIWGDVWHENLIYAKENYSWLRNIMMVHKDNINENWFIEIGN